MTKLLLSAGFAALIALPAAAQSTGTSTATAPTAADASAQAASDMTTRDEAQQAGQKVVPSRDAANPANDIKQMGSAAGATMDRRNQTEVTAEKSGAMAQAGVVAGKAVQDTGGQPVGTIEAIEGDLAVLATDTAKVRIPKASFADQNGVLVIAMTKDQVNAAAGRPGSAAPTSN